MTDDVRACLSLTMAGARRVIDAAVGHADRIGVPVCMAVVDRAGCLLAYLRMDGAPLLSEQLARDKAYTVVGFNGRPTHEWWEAIADDAPLRNGIVHTDHLVIFGGGVPIRVSGEVVGAIGISGGSAEQDREIAEAGIAALA
ncbi:GlcG/HbpS family heme-binding protein [Mycobacterium helveticum]|jgi:glc operon protein GlcG|uniref:Heme-binding protein n=1 Tax=Mycobacterium helveticum TaxID=2592811 RepID=A0A557XVZ1_9MYCO|nr:heme-binding protein [Mycobacterium helveticum]TVS90208.1 heme-binding protein [Mycobacterium helveticum]